MSDRSCGGKSWFSYDFDLFDPTGTLLGRETTERLQDELPIEV
jgi:hypothetical protein